MTTNDPQIISLENLKWEDGDIPGVKKAKVEFNACEAIIVFYPKGTNVPKHGHSGETMTIVLKGKCEGPQGTTLTPGLLYKCGGVQYGPWLVYEDTYFLIVQNKGTKFVKA